MALSTNHPPQDSTNRTRPRLQERCPAVVVALVVILSAAGCLSLSPIDSSSELPPPEERDPTPAPSTATPSPTRSRTAHNAGTFTQALVVHVIDGDTIKVRLDGSGHTIRYIGIDAPERGAPLGAAATAFNRDLVGGETVYLETDISETDEFGRLLRYVYLADGTFVNAEMVRQGLARAKTYPPDVARQHALDAHEERAQEAGRGIWHLDATPAPADGRGLRILAVDVEAEVVDLINPGDEVLDLTGWTLLSERGDQACRLAGELEPGEVLRVWSLARDSHRGGFNCGFDEPIWNNDEPDQALLYAPEGALVDTHP